MAPTREGDANQPGIDDPAQFSDPILDQSRVKSFNTRIRDEYLNINNFYSLLHDVVVRGGLDARHEDGRGARTPFAELGNRGAMSQMCELVGRRRPHGRPEP